MYMSIYITGARYSFTNLILFDYTGHNVGNITIAAPNLIKIVQKGYAPPVYI